MKKWVIFLFLASPVHAFTITAMQASATQEILSYTAPDSTACKVVISTSSNYTPIVHDVDSSLFTGSNMDNRAGALSNGTSRVFVAGTRIGQVGNDSIRYSRSLEAYRLHYATITCNGGVSAATTFMTQTIPLGDTYVDNIRSDPNSPGTYQYPDLINYATGQVIIDPENGARLTRVNLTTSSWGTGVSGQMSDGATRFCSPVISSDTFGNLGFHCMFGSELTFLNKETGFVTDLGEFVSVFKPVEDGWGGLIPCSQDNGGGGGWDTYDGNTSYCVFPTFDAAVNQTRHGVVRATYNGQNTAFSGFIPDCSANGNVQPCIVWTNLTPGHDNGNGEQDLAAMAVNFDSRYSTFTSLSSSGTLGIFDITNGHLYMQQNSSIQNSIAWFFVFTPGDGNPLHAGLSNGPHMIAGTPDYLNPPFRYCPNHVAVTADLYQDFVTGGSDSLGGEGGIGHNVLPGLGVYIAYATSTLTTTPSTCPSQPVGNTVPNWPTGNNCGTISVDGEVHNPNYYLGPPPEDSILAALPGDIFLSTGTNEGGFGEFFRLLIKNGATNWVVQRGYGWSGFNTLGSSSTLTAICGIATTFDSNIALGTSGLWYWDAINDPHGNNVKGNPFSIAHNIYDQNYLVGAGDAQGYEVYHGSVPTVYTVGFNTITWNNSFAGVIGADYPNALDTHPSLVVTDPTGIKSFSDGRAWTAGTYGGGMSATNPAGNIYKFASGILTMNRKQLPTSSFCGPYPMVDVSGPSSDVTVSTLTYCVVNKSGECYPASSIGEVYVNCQSVTKPFCDSPIIATNGSGEMDMCIGDAGPYLLQMVTTELPGPNSTGSGTRTFGHGYQIFRWNDPFQNPRPVVSTTTIGNASDGSAWMFFAIPGTSYSNASVYGNKLGIILMERIPPINTFDTLNRTDFIPTPITIAPSTFTVNNAVVQFGYTEYGSSTAFHCTSRNEACLATSSGTVTDANPFRFAVTESSTGISCTSGCTITLPLIPQRVAYYQVLYRNSSNTTVSTGPLQVAFEPAFQGPGAPAITVQFFGGIKIRGKSVFF